MERQWNLPALTYRDARAATLADLLDTSVLSLGDPPDLAAPADPLPGHQGQPVPPPASSSDPATG